MAAVRVQLQASERARKSASVSSENRKFTVFFTASNRS